MKILKRESHFHSTSISNLGNPSLYFEIIYLLYGLIIDVLGRIYVAQEGINAQLSVPKENIEKFKISVNEIFTS